MSKSQSLGAICHAALWDFDRSAGDPDTPDAWEAAATAVRKAVLEEAIEAIKALAGNTEQLKLHMGEMSAQEVRTLKSALDNLVPYKLTRLMGDE
jgi:hypothetical protein